MSEFKEVMNNWRNFKEAEAQMTKVVKKKVKKAVKQQQVILEENLTKTQQAMEEVAKDMPINLQEHFSENKNNIFVPVLDEATGQEQWESRNFDELLNEMDNPDSDIDEDKIYEMLEASIDHEATIYLNEAGLMDKVKGAVKGAKDKIKGALGKGKIFFFLKIVEGGLKLALKISKGIVPLITKALIKGVVIPLVQAWASGKSKASDLFGKIKEWGVSKMIPLMEKIMKPFEFIAQKITGNAQKAAELAPLLFSIAVLSLLLGVTYATGGLACFDQVSGGTQQGMAAVMESLPPDSDDLAGAMCAESNIIISDFSQQQILTEACGIIDAAGKEIDDAVTKRALQILAEKVNSNIDQVSSTVIQNIEGGIGEEMSEETVKLAAGKIDQMAEVVQTAAAQMSGAGVEAMGAGTTLDISALSGKQQEILMGAIKQAQGELGEYAGAAQLDDEAMKAWASSISSNYNVEASTEIMDGVQGSKMAEIVVSTSKQTLTKLNVPGVNESLKRMKELAGLLRS